MKKQQTHLLLLNKGENVRQKIEHYITEQNISFAWISAIGMIKNFTLGYFDEIKQQHVFKKIVESYELLSFIGNVAYDGQKMVLHAHASLSDNNYQVIGGHFGEGKVGQIMECLITPVHNAKIIKAISDKYSFPTLHVKP